MRLLFMFFLASFLIVLFIGSISSNVMSLVDLGNRSMYFL